MKFRAMLITFFFPNTAAAHAIRDAERGYPGEHDFVRVPLYLRHDLSEVAPNAAAAEVIGINRRIEPKGTLQ